jgi:predicted lactoylglutathione lyase
MIFVNLPVADLARSKAFYEAIGAVNQPKFTDETAACMVFSDTTFIMLLTHDKFNQFTSKRIADAHSTSEMLLVISQESREAVDAITDNAVAAGGRECEKAQDTTSMYSRCFEVSTATFGSRCGCTPKRPSKCPRRSPMRSLDRALRHHCRPRRAH